MPPGKSPNNSFNLHKDKMNDVFECICHQTCRLRIPLRRNILSFGPVDSLLSTLDFYWVVDSHGIRRLYSKGYINNFGLRGHLTSPVDRLSTEVGIEATREYYTDGVRAIGTKQ